MNIDAYPGGITEFPGAFLGASPYGASDLKDLSETAIGSEEFGVVETAGRRDLGMGHLAPKLEASLPWDRGRPIGKGVAGPQFHLSMKNKLTALEELEVTLTVQLQEPQKQPVVLHSGLAEFYYRKVAEMTKDLNVTGLADAEPHE